MSSRYSPHPRPLCPCARCEFACDVPTTRPSAHMGFPNNAIPRPAGICIECHVDGSASRSSPSWISSLWLYFKQSIICEYAPGSWLCRGRATWCAGSHTLVRLGYQDQDKDHDRRHISISGLVSGLTLSLTLDSRDIYAGLPLPEVRWQQGQPDGCGSVAGISSARSGPLWASPPPGPHRRPRCWGWRPGCRPYSA